MMSHAPADWSTDARVDEAATFIRGRLPAELSAPAWGLILGSGLAEALPTLEGRVEIELADVPHLRAPGITGHGSRLLAGRVGDVTLLAVEGRTHLYEGYGMDAVTLTVRVLAHLGVGRIILTCAAGGLNPAYERGDLIVVRDHINLMGANPLLGVVQEGKPAFLDTSDAYDVEMAEQAAGAGNAMGLRIAEGVYVAVSGPSYETAAELRFMRLVGGDAVGMSLVPETLAARLMDVKVLAMACITNTWDLRHPHGTSHEEVLETARAAAPGIAELLARLAGVRS
jgi:purine-nucleoside phosphorylase